MVVCAQQNKENARRCVSACSIGSSLFGALKSRPRKLPFYRYLTFFAGPRFSSRSALRPSQNGISRMRRPNLTRVLIVRVGPAQDPKRTHLIHRLAKDVPPPASGTLLFGSHFKWLPTCCLLSNGIPCHLSTYDA